MKKFPKTIVNRVADITPHWKHLSKSQRVALVEFVLEHERLHKQAEIIDGFRHSSVFVPTEETTTVAPRPWTNIDGFTVRTPVILTGNDPEDNITGPLAKHIFSVPEPQSMAEQWAAAKRNGRRIDTLIEGTDLIHEAIVDYCGPRCPDHEPNCVVCRTYAQYDALIAAVVSMNEDMMTGGAA